MLYGRGLDDALGHVQGSRYALVHAVSKRARQITLWLTADPAELRAASAPPPAPGELVTRDPIALAEAEIREGEVAVRWSPDGAADEPDLLEAEVDVDPLLIDGVADEIIGDDGGDGNEEAVTPALAQVLEADEGRVEESAGDEDDSDPAGKADVAAEALGVDGEDVGEVSLEEAAEGGLEAADDEDEPG